MYFLMLLLLKVVVSVYVETYPSPPQSIEGFGLHLNCKKYICKNFNKTMLLHSYKLALIRSNKHLQAFILNRFNIGIYDYYTIIVLFIS